MSKAKPGQAWRQAKEIPLSAPRQDVGGQRCEKCRWLKYDEDSRAVLCGHWRALEPANCPDFRDASRQIEMYNPEVYRG